MIGNWRDYLKAATWINCPVYFCKTLTKVLQCSLAAIEKVLQQTKLRLNALLFLAIEHVYRTKDEGSVWLGEMKQKTNELVKIFSGHWCFFAAH